MDNISGNLKNKIPRFESKNIRIVSCVFISSTVHYLVYFSGLCEHEQISMTSSYHIYLTGCNRYLSIYYRELSSM